MRSNDNLKSRYDYMDAIEDLMRKTDQYELIESILDRHGASDDDSDPDEGYYVTMSDDDIKEAYNDIVDALSDSDDPRIHYESLRNKRTLSEYESGWLDGYEASMNGSLGRY